MHDWRTPRRDYAAAGIGSGTGIVAEVTVSEQVTGHRGRALLFTWGGAALVVTSAVAAVAAAVVMAGRHHGLAASGGQRLAGIPGTTVSLLGLSRVAADPAPGFTLTDQDGRVLSLSGFRGKAVVLEFMDSRCTDICPLVSREFIDAYHDLGRAEGRVVFVAVNVNQRYNRVADVLAYSRAHTLTAIPDWYFFTGPAAALQAVWREYDIAVTAARQDSGLVHTATVYFIGPHGAEHYIAEPVADHADGGAVYLPAGQVSGWGRGIAQVAESMLR
jgi:cytochrome oxidase Cu insertion factor (SCO1/SenC/PrrC family)